MTKIVSRKLPNAVSNSDIGDPTVRNKVMLIQENIRSLASQLAEAQKALVELQGGSSKVNVASLASQVAPIVEDIVVTESATAYASSAAAASSASAASGSATEAGTSAANAASSASAASGSATDASGSALSASGSEANALSYKTDAESARDEAVSAASQAHVTGYIETGSFTHHHALAASSAYSAQVEVAKSGYSAIGVVSFNTGHYQSRCFKIVVDDATHVSFSVRNSTSTAISGGTDFSFVVLYMRTDSIPQS